MAYSGYYYSNLQPGATAPSYAQPLSAMNDTSAVNKRAAYGTKPAPVTPKSTIGTVLPQAISAGQQVYNQLPDYAGSMANIGKNIASETAGELPADVIAQLNQRAAERGVAIGSPGSDNSQSALLRAMGLTSLDLTNMGQNNLQNILPTLPGASIANNAGFYLNPGMLYEAETQNSLNAAAPDPYAAAMANMGAAGSGFAAGMGSAGMRLPPSPSSYMPAAQGPLTIGAQADQNTAGTFYNGIWYPPGVTPTAAGPTYDTPYDLGQEEDSYYNSDAYQQLIGG